MQVELNKKVQNPFYGMRKTLELMQRTSSAVSQGNFGEAYAECDTIEKKQLFYSLAFSIGDITARQHNIFKKNKVDSGGNSNRAGFQEFIKWLWKVDKKQFKKFLFAHLFNEYQCFDSLIQARVKTIKKSNKVEEVLDMLADSEYRKMLAEYFCSIINGNNPYDKTLISKFLSIPRLALRKGHKKMLPQTKTVMQHRIAFLKELSDMCKWEYKLDGNIVNFKGYVKWRKDYNGELESVLFSTGKIKEFNKEAFMNWLNRIPSNARFRVKQKVYKEVNGELKYPVLKEWFVLWEHYKEQKQEEQRKLEQKIASGNAEQGDLEKLAKVKKEAKVNIGATNFLELFNSIKAESIDKLKLESFIQNKVKLDYNTLVLLDASGSMYKCGSHFPWEFGIFLTAVCMYCNPNDESRNLVGTFNNTGTFYGYIDEQTTQPNGLMRGITTKTVKQPFINKEESFYDNYQRIRNFLLPKVGGGTSISSIISQIGQLIDINPQLKDILAGYPVWTIISDGEWNCLRSPEASINNFFRMCEQKLGFKPFLVCMDIAPYENGLSTNAERFSGIDNMIYIPSNPSQIEMFLTNFKDMEVFDVYTPLLSVYRSNRYELVRKYTI